MNRGLLRIILLPLLALIVCLSAVSCARSVATLDERDEQDPMMRRAIERKRANDPDRAIELFQKALEKRPSLARAHLELGLLYDGSKQDYLRAIYHYQRYLEKRPATEKRELIEDLIRRAKISYATTLPETPAGAMEEIANLKQENEMLRKRLAELSKNTDSKKSTKPASSKITPPPAPAHPSIPTYRVQSGDTLTRIAAKIYGDPNQWTKIFEANRDTLGKPENVRPGQVLVIPK